MTDAPPVEPTERARTQEAIRAIWRKHWASFSLIAKPLWDELDAAIRDDERTAALAEIARLTVRAQEGYAAHARSFGALAAISQLTDLGGEVDDYADVTRAVERICASRDALARDAERLKRDNEELRGVIETYGRVELMALQDRDILELRWQVSGLVFRAAGFDVFGAGIRECAERWNDKLRALRRAGMSVAEKMMEAFADADREQRRFDAARSAAPSTNNPSATND